MKRNPNGYGSVTKLKGNRSRPYVVRMTVYDEFGRGKQVPIGYAETKEKAMIMLAEYNQHPWSLDRETITFAELYAKWFDQRYPKLSTSNQANLRSAYKHCSKLYGLKYKNIKAFQMQEMIDSCDKSVSTKAGIKNLFNHLDIFAYETDVIDKMYSKVLTIPQAVESKRKPFSAEEIEKLWKIQSEPWVGSVLVYLYTGFRLTEFFDLEVSGADLNQGLLTGGKKTRAGKNRVIPIHHKIYPIIDRMTTTSKSGYLLEDSGRKMYQTKYRLIWNGVMDRIGADHVPHEARHTFETMLDNAGGNRKCIDMLMGHSSKDIGNRVYNHKTVDQLRETIELLK